MCIDVQFFLYKHPFKHCQALPVMILLSCTILYCHSEAWNKYYVDQCVSTYITFKDKVNTGPVAAILDWHAHVLISVCTN